MRRQVFRFLAIIWLGLLLSAPFAFCTATVILTRHAEKTESPTKNPPLSPAGERRAKVLATMLADAGVSAIFVSEYLRTQQTAAPLAELDHIDPQVVAANDPAALVTAIRARSDGVVLVVGHSNTVPEIIARLGGPTVTIVDSDYDNLFVLTLGGQKTQLLRLHYGEGKTSLSALTSSKEHNVQIKFMRSGGFAGMATNVEGKVTTHGDSGEVTAPGGYRRSLDAQEVQLLSQSADVKSLSAAASNTAVADGYQYDVTVARDGKSQTVTLQGEHPLQTNKLLGWVAQECQRIWEYRIKAQ